MNALASVLTSTIPAGVPASTPGTPSRVDDDATDKSGFAQCMAHAQQAHTPAPQDEAPAVDDAAGDAPVDAAVAQSDPPPAPAPDLAALLPGWAAAPAVAIGDGAAATRAASGVEVDAVLESHAKTAKPAAASQQAQSVPTASSGATLPTVAERSHDVAPPAHASDVAARLPAEPRAKAAEPALIAGPGVAPPAAPLAAPRALDAASPMAHLPAPIETPAFAPALATQVRWWAQDGVQQAQLTLTPPEMGPVSVKIVMNDQREARIDFVADMAATRSALEAALPVLAAALDESGLKLSGGGVHDGAAQRQALWQHAQQNGASPSRGAAAPAAGHSVTAGGGAGGTHAQGARGLVDLVA